MKETIVIGGGIAGLAASAMIAKHIPNAKVVLLEKNSQLGGRARQFSDEGFVFDMGPSWYWMPDIFERFYNLFDQTTADFYELKRLEPSYQIFFKDEDIMQLPADFGDVEMLFERYEPGSAQKLRQFLKSAQYKYEVGIGEFVHKPSLSVFEYADFRLLREAFRIKLFSNISAEIKSLFKNPKLIQVLEFPVLFLGAMPSDTPALYSLMNYADIKLGTWYPMGGMHGIVTALSRIAEQQGVLLKTNQEVKEVLTEGNRIKALASDKKLWNTDAVLATADYHHIETDLLHESHQTYSKGYWDSRKMAPSALVIYMGIKGRVEGLLHHNLFFDADFEKHSGEIYKDVKWPDDPLFYVCCPSKTDPEVAPPNCENLFVLIPLAPGLEDSLQKREELLDLVIERMEDRLNTDIKNRILYKKTYCLDDFKSDYHSFKGNAYGLANTLLQTAFLKPRMKSGKLKNLYYAGQLTTPGPGLPPSLISGEVAAKLLVKDFK